MPSAPRDPGQLTKTNNGERRKRQAQRGNGKIKEREFTAPDRWEGKDQWVS